MNELDPMFLKYCTHRQLNSVPDYLHVYLHIPHSTAIAQVTLPKYIRMQSDKGLPFNITFL